MPLICILSQSCYFRFLNNRIEGFYWAKEQQSIAEVKSDMILGANQQSV